MYSPERVSDSILKVEEIVFIDAQQVTGVEVHVSFLVDVMQLLLLSLLQVSRITVERRIHCYFTNQESRLTCGRLIRERSSLQVVGHNVIILHSVWHQCVEAQMKTVLFWCIVQQILDGILGFYSILKTFTVFKDCTKWIVQNTDLESLNFDLNVFSNAQNHQILSAHRARILETPNVISPSSPSTL